MRLRPEGMTPHSPQTSDSVNDPEDSYSTVQSEDTQEGDLGRIFNTAMVSTLPEDTGTGDEREMASLLKSPAFEALLLATQHLSHSEGMDLKEAAETVIRHFRLLDKTWRKYTLNQGIERIKQGTV